MFETRIFAGINSCELRARIKPLLSNTRVKNGYADFGESSRDLEKVLLLLPNMALFWHFRAKVKRRKYFRQVMSQAKGETKGETKGESVCKTSLIWGFDFIPKFQSCYNICMNSTFSNRTKKFFRASFCIRILLMSNFSTKTFGPKVRKHSNPFLSLIHI